MATYVEQPVHHDRIIERETRDSDSGAGVWAVLAVVIVLLAILFFGSNRFGSRGTNTTNSYDIKGSIQTPSGNTSGSGSATPAQ